MFVDAAGERLPTLRVHVEDADGKPVRIVTHPPDRGLFVSSDLEARDGALRLIAPPPGVLVLELELPDVCALGTCRVVLGQAEGGARTVALERTLDEVRAELRARRADQAEDEP